MDAKSERGSERERDIREIMAEDFLSFKKETETQIQKAQHFIQQIQHYAHQKHTLLKMSQVTTRGNIGK